MRASGSQWTVRSLHVRDVSAVGLLLAHAHMCSATETPTTIVLQPNPRLQTDGPSL